MPASWLRPIHSLSEGIAEELRIKKRLRDVAWLEVVIPSCAASCAASCGFNPKLPFERQQCRQRPFLQAQLARGVRLRQRDVLHQFPESR